MPHEVKCKEMKAFLVI